MAKLQDLHTDNNKVVLDAFEGATTGRPRWRDPKMFQNRKAKWRKRNKMARKSRQVNRK